MKILQINTVYGWGSTGKISQGIHDICIKKGMLCVTAYRYREKSKHLLDDSLTTSSWLDCHIHNRLARYTGLQGCFSSIRTVQFLGRISRYKPDVVQLHNLHGSYINHRLLFNYIKNHRIRVVWTLHDCWAFTGQCPHFTAAKCDKWKDGCHHCPQIHNYPDAMMDLTCFMWQRKKKWFTGIEDMTIVTPSKWLADLVRQSYLKEYPVQVINNGIDLRVFKPTPSDFRIKHHCEDKFILLGVAFGWGERKGLDVFVKLAKRMDKRFQIVLVGTNDTIDAQLPENIVSIHQTNDQQELAEIYTAADLFVNPTREENYPTVNMEAIACGTPVVTFRTGGSPEILDCTCGSVVKCDDINALEREILRISKDRPYSKEACLERAKAFDMYAQFREYVELYERKTS